MKARVLEENIIYVDFTSSDEAVTEVEDPFGFFEDEYKERIAALQANIDDYESAVNESKNSSEKLTAQIVGVLTAQVFGPLGLSADVFGDKKGGNVTTTHNAKQKIFAHKEEEYNRDDYVKHSYTKTRDKKIEENKAANGGKIIDGYTGREVTNPDADHVVSMSEAHGRGGFRATAAQKEKIGSAEDNIVLTDKGLNRSKGDQDINEFADKTSSDGTQTNKEKYGIDENKVKEAKAKAEETVEELLPSKTQAFVYDAKMITKEGAKTGAKSALRVAVMKVIGKFVEGVIRILKDAVSAFKETKGEGYKVFFNALKNKIIAFKEEFLNADEIIAFIKDVAQSAAASFSGGIVSTIITYIINTFLTTAAKIVTIIRESIDAVSQTIKVMCDKNRSVEERAEAASQILVTALFSAVGVMLVQYLAAQLKTIPIISEIGEDIASVIVNIITGLISVIVVHLITTFINNQAIVHKAKIAAYSGVEIAYLESAKTAKMAIEVANKQQDIQNRIDNLSAKREKTRSQDKELIDELKNLLGS
ncbi:MAG: hypothetical protein IJO03_05645 [Clostridia bacterium]|nr:hypothetical protein [Clostridia bacterium]